MAALTTRLKFNTPDNTDLADPSVYYNPNLVILENEIPSVAVANLGTPTYDGQVRTSTGDGWSLLTASAYGGKWYNVGNFQPNVYNYLNGIGMFNNVPFVDDTGNTYSVTYNGSTETWGSPFTYGVQVLSLTAKQSLIVKLSTVIIGSTLPATGYLNLLLGSSTTPPTQANYQAIVKFPISIQAARLTSLTVGFDASVIPGFAVKSFSVIPSATAGSWSSLSLSSGSNYNSSHIEFEVYNR